MNFAIVLFLMVMAANTGWAQSAVAFGTFTRDRQTRQWAVASLFQQTSGEP